MFLSNEDMYLLNEIASVLQIDNGSVPKSNVEEFVKLIEKLEKQKAKNREKTRAFVNSKRQQDKTYGQSYKRKNQILGL